MTSRDATLSVGPPSPARCFGFSVSPAISPIRHRLPDQPAEALAELLSVLGCGEEAASLAFGNLARSGIADAAGVEALERIAAEEQVHDGLIQSLSAGLPEPTDPSRLRAMSRRFHLELGRGDHVVRLARIASLDSAVCLILSRLVRPGTPISQDPGIARVLRRIARDEARHVRITRQLARDRAEERTLLGIGNPVREALATLLEQAGDAFEALAFDPRWLRTDLACVPAGLYRR